MKYTTNYNLYKPDYEDTIDVDFLNKNMDVLDNQINGLDYVQNVNTSDNGLTFIKRNGDTIPVSLDYMKIAGGNFTGNITILNNQVIYATKTITDETGNYYTEYSDGSIVCGGVYTDLNQGGVSGDTYDINTYAKRITYLKPINKTLIGFTAMLLPDDKSSFWGNSSACAMLRQPDTTGFYIECRSSYSTMLLNTSKCMWRAYFK